MAYSAPSNTVMVLLAFSSVVSGTQWFSRGTMNKVWNTITPLPEVIELYGPDGDTNIIGRFDLEEDLADDNKIETIKAFHASNEIIPGFKEEMIKSSIIQSNEKTSSTASPHEEGTTSQRPIDTTSYTGEEDVVTTLGPLDTPPVTAANVVTSLGPIEMTWPAEEDIQTSLGPTDTSTPQAFMETTGVSAEDDTIATLLNGMEAGITEATKMEIPEASTTTLEPPPADKTSENPTESEPQETDIRLPETVRPVHYTIKLHPFLHGNKSIHGFLEVEIEVLKNTSEIVIHAADIQCYFNTAKVVSLDDSPAPGIVAYVVDPGPQFLIAHLSSSLVAGRRYKYSMFYAARLRNDPKGLYTASYSSTDGTEKRFAATFFQPTDARRAFPCFDEPALKATFDITLVRELNMTAISNMPLQNTTYTEDLEGWATDQFETTPPMSTYLVVLVICQFENINTTVHNDIPLRLWARGEVLHSANTSLELSEKYIYFFENYFNISYSLPKLDIIVLPNRHVVAFEGWGAIVFYAEEFIKISTDKTTQNHPYLSGLVLAHEVAHQWFGNLVTPVWWQDVWLNEGFASYMENVAQLHVNPEWNIEDHQVMKDLHGVMRLDGYSTSHPVSVPLHNPEDIFSIFDRISYEKGSSIIRMMNHYLTEGTFRRAITNYLTEHKYGNAEQDDLWETLSEVGHADGTLPKHMTVKGVMDTWTLQTGYPVVTVLRSEEGTQATIAQERFLLLRNDTSDNKDYKWWIPLTYTTQSEQNFSNTQCVTWMQNSSSNTLITGLPDKDQWILFNLQQTGFYRVNYDDDNWDRLIQQLQVDHEVIAVMNRAQLLDDAMNLALSGRLSYEKVLNMTLYLKKEKELSVWNAVFGNIGNMQGMLDDSNIYGGFQKYVLSLLIPLYEQLGLHSPDGEPFTNSQMRENFVKWACDLGYVHCVRTAKDVFKDWMTKPKNNITATIYMTHLYCTAISNGGEEEWNFAFEQYNTTDSQEEKDRLIKALSCTNDAKIRRRFISIAFSDLKFLRAHDTHLIFSSMASRRDKHQVVWNFLRSYWDFVPTLFGSGYRVAKNFLTTATKYLSTEAHLDELKAFKEVYGANKAYGKAADVAIRRTSHNIDWIKRNYDDIRCWLEEHGWLPGN